MSQQQQSNSTTTNMGVAVTPVGDHSVVDASDNTGETVIASDIIPHSAIEGLVASLRDFGSVLPIHQQMLQLQPDAAVREAISNVYEGSEPITFKEVAGSEHAVLGMMIYEHGGYNGKDGLYHAEGYYQIRILLDEQDNKGRYIVVKSSSTGLAMHVFNILNNRGWFLFPEPITYRFSVGSGNTHHIYNTSHSLPDALKRSRKSEGKVK